MVSTQNTATDDKFTKVTRKTVNHSFPIVNQRRIPSQVTREKNNKKKFFSVAPEEKNNALLPIMSRRLLAHLAAGFVTELRAQLVNTGHPWSGRAATYPS
jgi:hypothetical protein